MKWFLELPVVRQNKTIKDIERAGEIFQLTWDKVDLTNRVIRLEAKDTKTAEPRVVFLCDQAYDILREAGKVRFLEHNRVFTYMGKPLNKIKKALPNACRKAEIAGFRFHDLRYTSKPICAKRGSTNQSS